MRNDTFWQTVDLLVSTSEIVVDRPQGTPHPRRQELIYPLNYGYLNGTVSGDGHGIDVWLGRESSGRVTAIACTVDVWKRDAELKILIGCTDDDIEDISNFLNVMAQLPCMIIKRQ